MGTLTGKQIDQTYDGLIKTNDEQPIGIVPKRLEDGLGNDLPVQVGTAGMIYNGTQDFTAATVTGIAGTTYQFDFVGDGNNIVLEVLPSVGTQTDLTFIPGTNVTFGLLNSNEITINSSGGTPVTYTIAATQATPSKVEITLTGSDGSTDTISLGAGSNVTITEVNDLITFESSDTNTTYDLTAGQNGANVEIQLDPSVGTTDVVTLVAGTNMTLTQAGNNITLDAAGGSSVPEFSSAYRNEIYSATMGGYPSNTFAKHMQPIVGRPFMGAALDQFDNSTLFVRCYGNVGSVMSTIIVPLFAGTATDVVVEWYSADSTTGMPGTKVYSESFPEPTGAEGFYEFNLTTPQTMNGTDDWWVGCRTSSERKLAQIGGDDAIHTMAAWGGYCGSIAGFTPINTMYYSFVPVPGTIPTNHAWSGRDELTMYFWK